MGRQIPFTKVPMAALASVVPPDTHPLLQALDQMQDRLNEALRPLRQSPQQLVTQKGSLVASSGPGAPVEHKVGANRALLVADSTQTNGIRWGAATPFFNVMEYGAKGDGIADDTAAIQLAIDTGGDGSQIVFPPGNYLCKSGLTTHTFQTLRGTSNYLGAGASPRTRLNFTGLSGAAIGITMGVNSVYRDLQLRGPGKTVGTVTAMKSVVVSSPRFHGIEIYDFVTGVSLASAFYSFFDHCEFSRDATAILLSSCTNVHIVLPRFSLWDTTSGTGGTAVDSTASSLSNLTVFGGSIEGHSSAGAIRMTGGPDQTLLVAGTYWESSVSGSGAIGIQVGGDSGVELHGCYVNLNENNRWLNASGNTNVSVSAHGNTFTCPVGSSSTPIAYVLPASGDVDIGEDNFAGMAKGTYVGGTLNSGAVTNFNIRPPLTIGTFLSDHNFVGRALCMPLMTAAPHTPKTGGIYYADHATWDPLLQTPALPYFVLYDGTNYRKIGSPGLQMSAVPIAGTWAQGDVIWNTTVAAGGSPGWVCTTGGTPGTWKAMANVAP